MYDSVITLIQMLDNSERRTALKISNPMLIVEINSNRHIFRYSQEGVSEAIEELENLL